MKFHCNFIFPRITLRHMIQRYLKRRLIPNIKTQHSPIELGRAPIPPLQTQLPLQRILMVRVTEKLGDFLLIRVLETGETVQRSIFLENTQAPRSTEILKVHHVQIVRLQLFDFAGFAVFESDTLVGHFQFAGGLNTVESWENCAV